MALDKPAVTYEAPAAIKAYLPHRYPFLFIDQVISCQAGQMIRAAKNITHSDCYGTDADRCFPSEYILEIFGQAAILLFYADESKKPDKVTPVLVGVESFEVFRSAGPGDRIEVDIQFDKVISKAAIIKAAAFLGQEIIAKARLTAGFISENPADSA